MVNNRPEHSSSTSRLAPHVVETEQQRSRATAAIAQLETNRRLRDEADARAFEQYFAGMSALARWFAQPLLTFITAQRPIASAAENPAIEGLNLVLARLPRALADHGIERIATEGQPFNEETMRAIGAGAADEWPLGHVAEQLFPR